MKSCSIHHCVLLFLTLTLTTAPASAVYCPVLAKLHQPVTLPCLHECSGPAKWALDSARDVVFAECDQTSCRTLKEGYNMSYARYLKGDLSLTITSANYSMRDTYTCECYGSDILTVRLSIDTVIAAVQMKLGEDLTLDVSVPEAVVVIYKSSDAADGEQICNVTQTHRLLRCKAEYTARTSLSYPRLTLRGVQRRDSGSYTIRDTDNNADIRVYNISLSGLTNGETAGIVIGVLVLVLGLIGVITYMKIKAAAADQEFKEVESQMKEVDELMKQVQQAPGEQNITDNNQLTPEELENMREAVNTAETRIQELQDQYRDNGKYSKYIELFCENRKMELSLHKNLYTPVQNRTTECLEPEEVMEMMEEVVSILVYLRCQEFKLRHSMDPRYMCLHVEGCLCKIKNWYMNQKTELNNIKQWAGSEAITIMETLLDTYEQWCQDKEKKLSEVREKLNPVEGPNRHGTPALTRKGDREYYRSLLFNLHSIIQKHRGCRKHDQANI